MDDNQLIKTKAQLFAMHQAVAFLLAGEAARSKSQLTLTHSALVAEVISACSKAHGPADLAGQFEAAVSAELDSLFCMAHRYFDALPYT